MHAKKMVLGLMALFLLLTMACTLTVNGVELGPLPVDELRTETKSIELGQARSARAKVSMGAGELNVSGGAESLVDADFTYNVDDWTPEVTYEINDAQGKLTIQQPSVQFSGFPTDATRNKWDVRLNNEVPLDLVFEMGAGAGELNLQGLSLERVELKTGAGETHLNLADSSVPILVVDGGIGEVTVDLTGRWENDLEAEIKNGIGELNLRLPRQVGVRIEIETGMSEVSANGLRKEGSAYVNDAYGRSETTLYIDLKGGVGHINLQLG